MAASSKIKTVLTGFNNHFDEFVADLVRIFPNDADILGSQTKFRMLRKANPKILINAWYQYAVQKYKDQIDEGDICFFMNKDYSDDVVDMENKAQVVEAINRLRDPIRRMNEDDRIKTMKYLKNLKQLSEMYYQ